MATRITTQKVVEEEVTLQSSMLDRLLEGETIASVASAIYVWSGVDAASAGVLSGSPSHSNGVISQLVVGGVAGVIYKVNLTATTSLANVLTNEVKLAVLDANPETI